MQFTYMFDYNIQNFDPEFLWYIWELLNTMDNTRIYNYDFLEKNFPDFKEVISRSKFDRPIKFMLHREPHELVMKLDYVLGSAVFRYEDGKGEVIKIDSPLPWTVNRPWETNKYNRQSGRIPSWITTKNVEDYILNWKMKKNTDKDEFNFYNKDDFISYLFTNCRGISVISSNKFEFCEELTPPKYKLEIISQSAGGYIIESTPEYYTYKIVHFTRNIKIIYFIATSVKIQKYEKRKKPDSIIYDNEEITTSDDNYVYY